MPAWLYVCKEVSQTDKYLCMQARLLIIDGNYRNAHAYKLIFVGMSI